MAERAARKTKRPAARRRTETAGNGATQATGRETQRIKTLERERDKLKNQLKEAEDRIKRLEESRTEAVNRIDWVIDSLHNVLDSGA
jgi:predicted  nucleic acid-binding Zn-ribbon protein